MIGLICPTAQLIRSHGEERWAGAILRQKHQGATGITQRNEPCAICPEPVAAVFARSASQSRRRPGWGHGSFDGRVA
jgi:hypothetical protein